MSDEKYKKPNFMLNSIDIKGSTLLMFDQIINSIKEGKIKDVSVSENTIVRIFTNYGIVEGKILDVYAENFEENSLENKEYDNFLSSVILKLVNNSLENLESEIGADKLRLFNTSKTIFITDATITPFANPYNKFKVAKYLLFSDHITGISFGELQQTTDNFSFELD